MGVLGGSRRTVLAGSSNAQRQHQQHQQQQGWHQSTIAPGRLASERELLAQVLQQLQQQTAHLAALQQSSRTTNALLQQLLAVVGAAALSCTRLASAVCGVLDEWAAAQLAAALAVQLQATLNSTRLLMTCCMLLLAATGSGRACTRLCSSSSTGGGISSSIRHAAGRWGSRLRQALTSSLVGAASWPGAAALGRPRYRHPHASWSLFPGGSTSTSTWVAALSTRSGTWACAVRCAGRHALGLALLLCWCWHALKKQQACMAAMAAPGGVQQQHRQQQHQQQPHGDPLLAMLLAAVPQPASGDAATASAAAAARLPVLAAVLRVALFEGAVGLVCTGLLAGRCWAWLLAWVAWLAWLAHRCLSQLQQPQQSSNSGFHTTTAGHTLQHTPQAAAGQGCPGQRYHLAARLAGAVAQHLAVPAGLAVVALWAR